MENDINYRKAVKRLKTKLGRVVDAAFVFKRPLGLSDALVILHGTSCSGKSTILRALARRFRGFAAVEGDRLGYMAREPDGTDGQLMNETFEFLLGAGIDQQRARRLLDTVDEFAALEGLRYPPHRTMTGLIRACCKNSVVVATCGNLPPPTWQGGFYRELTSCTGQQALHVLIAPEEADFRRRVEARNLGERMETLVAGNAWRLDRQGDYGLVLDGSEAIEPIVGMIRERIRPLASHDAPSAH